MISKVLKSAVFISCLVLMACSSKEPGDLTVKPGEGTTVYLKINTSPKSRADEATATDTSAELYTAIVYFVNGEEDPLIYDVITAGPSGQDITISDLEEGYLVEDVNTAVTQVYVVGNYNSVDQENNGPSFPMNIGGRLSAVKAVVLDIQQVSYPAVTGVTGIDRLVSVMDGQAALQTYGTYSDGWNGEATPAADDQYANVTISPIVARIEIEEIVYTGTFGSFTLDGIYINDYYQKAPLSLDMDGYAPMNNGSDVDAYDVDNSSFAYNYYTTMFDYLDTPAVITGGEATFTPVNGVWAYQVFGDSSPVPHIILKLTDVTTSGGTDLEDQYLTITGFRMGGTDLTRFDRNTIYKISAIEFSDDDLDLFPEPETINVWVHVEVAEWETVNVTPII
ncbi:MAG: hypothetical protein LUF87_05040 [Alistipes sp.]|nr:hypothetical protein [Alistipes sp.]